MNLWNFLTIASVSLWLGAMIFFSAFVAPAAFSVLDRESAGRLVGAVFPRYYLFGMVLGSLALSGVVRRFLAGGPLPWGALVLLLMMLGMSGFSLLVLLPQLQASRPAIPGGSLTFARLHGLSVVLNLATILAGLTLLFIEGLRVGRGAVT